MGRRMMADEEIARILINIEISLTKLIEGGAAILDRVARNHQSGRKGKIGIIPLFKKILREWNISYEEFANANRNEDDRP